MYVYRNQTVSALPGKSVTPSVYPNSQKLVVFSARNANY